MTAEVVAVHSDTPATEIARILLQHGISAAPVLDSAGALVGMVSEGDLLGRDSSDRDARRDWWLNMLAEGHPLNPDFMASIVENGETAKDVMSYPVVTVTETTGADEIARLLAEYRIKRVPVLRGETVVGIVSRADLLKALAAEHAQKAAHRPAPLAEGVRAAIESIDRHFFHLEHGGAHPEAGKPTIAPASGKPTAADLRHLVADFEQQQGRRHEQAQRAEAERRKARVKQLIDEHIEDDTWQVILHKARNAAAHGEKHLLLLRFPSQLCSDGGRAINISEPDWPETLRGEAAEVYLRWEHELKPLGFHLAAQVLDFPGGLPGDIGLFLIWGG